MNATRTISILAAVALATTVVPGALGQATNQFQVADVAHEPDTAADAATNPNTDRTYNGFADAGDHDGDGADHEWDLVLNQFQRNGWLAPVEANAVYRDILYEAGADDLDADGDGRNDGDERFLLPGVVDGEAHWGWYRDKGSAGYLREAGAGSDNPDDVIDDGNDNGTADVHVSNATSCSPADPACWQDTGGWDEFIWRGPNTVIDTEGLPHVDTSDVDPDDPAIATYPDDEIYGFIQPGTHFSYFVTATGNEGDDTPVRTPGAGVISEGADQAQQPDVTYSFIDSTLVNGEVQLWAGALKINDDQSLLMATEITAAVNPADTGSGLKRDPADSTARDVDVYSAISPQAEALYRTAVWDPGDEEDTADGVNGATGNDHDEGEGAKARLKHFYSNDYPELGKTIFEEVNELTQPAGDVLGLADDYAVTPEVDVFQDLEGAPYKHEPNHADDDYPGASRGPNPADYNGQLGEDQDGDGETPYYEPNTQDWSGYADNEQLYIDFQNRWNTYLVAAQGAFGWQFGHNLDSPTGQQEQQTQGPGILSHFGYVGTWWDVNGDTWVGDLNETGRCSAQESEGPYCSGQDDDPNDFTHNPQRFPGDDTTAEFRGTCGADVSVTVEPVGTPTNDQGEHAWGDTQPPHGVYIYPIGEEENLPDQGDPPQTADNVLGRYVQYGPITFEMPPSACDADDAASGQWFPEESVLLPTGSADFPIRMTATVELTEDRTDRSGDLGTITGQTVTDVDTIYEWT